MATADPHHNITFRPPVYLGAVGWGLTDTVNFGNGTFAVVVAGAAGVGTRTLLSRNGGVAYTNAANATAVLGTNTIRMPGQYPTAHDFGAVGNGALRSPTARYWELRGRQETEVHTYTRDTPVVFQGLPMHLKCDAKYSTCPIRLQGSGAVRFGDGTLLQSAIVYTAARGDATSVVCFRSTDGLRWTYTGTIANASNYTASEEGPNENDLAMLDFGVVLAVIRTDGGDGLPGHVYKSYSYSYSMDGGFTWTPLAAMPGTGCARPRLLMLGGGFAPLLMSGGRMRSSGTDDNFVWVEWTGMGPGYPPKPPVWETFSVSYYHNLLAGRALPRFTKAVNSSSVLETTSYTSLVPVGKCSAVLLYDIIKNGTHHGFSMRIDIHADAGGETGIHC